MQIYMNSGQLFHNSNFQLTVTVLTSMCIWLYVFPFSSVHVDYSPLLKYVPQFSSPNYNWNYLVICACELTLIIYAI